MVLVVCMSNGASLLLPGSNLTNLIVLQQSRDRRRRARSACRRRLGGVGRRGGGGGDAALPASDHRRDRRAGHDVDAVTDRSGGAGCRGGGRCDGRAPPAPAAAPVVVGLGVVLAARRPLRTPERVARSWRTTSTSRSWWACSPSPPRSGRSGGPGRARPTCSVTSASGRPPASEPPSQRG